MEDCQLQEATLQKIFTSPSSKRTHGLLGIFSNTYWYCIVFVYSTFTTSRNQIWGEDFKWTVPVRCPIRFSRYAWIRYLKQKKIKISRAQIPGLILRIQPPDKFAIFNTLRGDTLLFSGFCWCGRSLFSLQELYCDLESTLRQLATPRLPLLCLELICTKSSAKLSMGLAAQLS